MNSLGLGAFDEAGCTAAYMNMYKNEVILVCPQGLSGSQTNSQKIVCVSKHLISWSRTLFLRTIVRIKQFLDWDVSKEGGNGKIYTILKF